MHATVNALKINISNNPGEKMLVISSYSFMNLFSGFRLICNQLIPKLVERYKTRLHAIVSKIGIWSAANTQASLRTLLNLI